VLLALAGAGGSTGARRLALLVTDRDWDLVADGVARTIRQRSDSDVVRVLDALAAASNEPSADARDFRELSALIAAALAATAQRCERGAAPIDVELIGAFSRLTGKVLDPPSLPCLDRTWTELLPGPMDLDSPSGVDSAVRWLQLGEILREHAPDRARRYGFPTQHRARIYALVDGANRLLACSGTGAQHGQLLDLLRLCRRAVAGEPARVPGLDEAIWQANRMTETEQPASSLLFPEWSVRQHVELILEDL
jgi:hypothetical protein